MDTFIIWASDKTDQNMDRAILEDKPEQVSIISQKLELGNKIWKSWVELNGGEIIGVNGEEGQAKVPSDKLEELDKVRIQYGECVGSTISVGAGMKLSEAEKAAQIAKIRGGNMLVFYTEELEKELNDFYEVSDSDSLSKADPHVGVTGPHRPVAPAPPIEIQPEAPPVEMPPPPEDLQAEEEKQREDLEGLFHNAAVHNQAIIEHAHRMKEVDGKKESLKQDIVKVLQKVKAIAPALEEVKGQAPEVYETIMETVKAMALMAQQLMGKKEEPKPDTEQSEASQEEAK